MPALSGTTSWIEKENQTVQGKQQPINYTTNTIQQTLL